MALKSSCLLPVEPFCFQEAINMTCEYNWISNRIHLIGCGTLNHQARLYDRFRWFRWPSSRPQVRSKLLSSNLCLPWPWRILCRKTHQRHWYLWHRAIQPAILTCDPVLKWFPLFLMQYLPCKFCWTTTQEGYCNSWHTSSWCYWGELWTEQWIPAESRQCPLPCSGCVFLQHTWKTSLAGEGEAMNL